MSERYHAAPPGALAPAESEHFAMIKPEELGDFLSMPDVIDIGPELGVVH